MEGKLKMEKDGNVIKGRNDLNCDRDWDARYYRQRKLDNGLEFPKRTYNAVNKPLSMDRHEDEISQNIGIPSNLNSRSNV
jgi:hypothetical protein